MKIKSANEVQGVLIRSLGSDNNPTFLFRVYEDSGEFKDYDISHSDLSVTINDADAYFYEDQEKEICILDHSPKTLGK